MSNILNVTSINRIRTDTDGEGVTTLVVSMGCPLRCAYCINPHTWDGSGTSKQYTVDDLYNELKIDNLYFLTTGGGIVFGGGEPLLNASFISDFAQKYSKTKWKILVESSLNVERDKLTEVIPYIDKFIVDVKDMNKQRYEAYTSANYDRFYENLLYLRDNVPNDKILVKVPKIFGFHKNKEWIESIDILKKLGFSNIALFDYVDTEQRKNISEAAKQNKRDFIDKYVK